jgi:hypothetical protein
MGTTMVSMDAASAGRSPAAGLSGRQFGLMAAVLWLGVAAACCAQAVAAPEAALAHAAWCLTGPAAGLEGPQTMAGALVLGHCGWCWGAVGAGMAALLQAWHGIVGKPG